MTNLIKRVFTHKSKLLLTLLCLLGLAFSYSCSCRDNSSVSTNPNIFRVSEANGNVKTAIVKSTTTDNTGLKLDLYSDKSFDFTYTIEDSEPDENKKITSDDFTKMHEGLTPKESLAEKVKKWETTDGPTTKTITVKFTVSAEDTTLKNAVQTVSVQVKLTHAKEINDDNISEYLKKGDSITLGETGFGGEVTVFNPANGTYNKVGNVFTIPNGVNDKKKEYSKKQFELYGDFYLTKQYPFTSGGTLTKKEGGRNGDNHYTLTYENIIYKDEYECQLDKIVFKFEVKNGGSTWTE